MNRVFNQLKQIGLLMSIDNDTNYHKGSLGESEPSIAEINGQRVRIAHYTPRIPSNVK